MQYTEVKAYLKKLKRSNYLGIRIIYVILKSLNEAIKIIFNGNYRAQYLTAWRSENKYYQRSNFTLTNRYPELFRQCQLYLEKSANPKILSFGCSTGEEVFTIGEYLPNALVFGVDINTWCIKQCKRNIKPPFYL